MSEEQGGFDELEEIAVVGLAGRFPKAVDIDEFWENLCNGVDGLQEFSNEELEGLGISSQIYQRDNFVRRGTRLPFMDCFDANFFGFTPREASQMDPQSRVFLETCYSALEHAGYDPFTVPVPVGVFSGSNPSDYAGLLGIPDLTDSLTAFDQLIATDKDFLATRVSHRLNLRGPAMNIQTACSTSLVTIHMAARSLLDYQCDMALAGGVNVNLRQGVGYFAQQGMILSPDGKCRAFDKNANGTTLGQAVGVVVLKRLSEALRDRDTVYAIVKGSALNNDGAAKISYTAPSEDGQAEVIALAHSLAGVSADDISYVEAHGTGTKLGDPIEVAALRRAFQASTNRTGYCAIGSVKTSVGHTDAAAGVTGFIKTVLSLHHKKIPPILHFEEPNPALEIESSPFFINTKLLDWETGGKPRMAAISAFGIGGTNAHAILSEAPEVSQDEEKTKAQVLVLSAKSSNVLSEMSEDLIHWLDNDTGQALSDAAFTLQTGRAAFEHRLCVVQSEKTGSLLREGPRAGVIRGVAADRPNVVFMFSGQGSQYTSMARGLYQSHTAFRDAFDECEALFEPLIDIRLRDLVFADFDDAQANEKLKQTRFTQPALFSIEYAVSRQLMAWGFQPSALLGHSIGEYAAICIAEVLSLEDSVEAVAARGRLMQSMKPGAMLAVHGSSKLLDGLPIGVEGAAYNTPELTVVAGEFAAIEAFETRLASSAVRSSRLHTSHAFHSAMMEPLLDEYRQVLSKLKFHAPKIPVASNVTGNWLTDTEAVDPDYWCMQIRKPVLFRDALATVVDSGNATTLIEVGPGRTLVGFARDCHDDIDALTAISAVRHPKDERPDEIAIREAVGKAWVSGVSIDWQALHESSPRRIALPGYRFERERHWAPQALHQLAIPTVEEPSSTTVSRLKRLPIDRWLYVPSWRRLAPAQQNVAKSYLLIGRPSEALTALAVSLTDAGAIVHVMANGSARALADRYQRFRTENALPDVVVHLQAAQFTQRPASIEQLDVALSDGLDSVLDTIREVGRASPSTPLRLDIVTTGTHQALGNESVYPESAALLGPAKVVSLEYPNLKCRLIDLDDCFCLDHVKDLSQELKAAPSEESSLALRNGYRWAPTFASLGAASSTNFKTRLRHGGKYLIVGGMGGVGLSIAEHLATKYNASLALTSRSGRPQRPLDDDDSELSHRLELIDRIEQVAEKFEIVAVDASDLGAMTRAVSQVEGTIGRLDGVIVAAGVADMAGAIHNRTHDANRQSIAAKVHGSFVLERVFADRKLDFILLSSSIATALYHNRFAQVGYVTGNSYAEACGLSLSQSGTPVVTVAWDDWMELGMSVRAAKNFANTYGDDIKLMDDVHSFTPAEGVKLFEYVLSANQGLLYVSTTDLNERALADVNVVSPFLQQAVASDSEHFESDEGDSRLESIIRIWESLLGFEGVKSDDNFFELGGDSLQVARMVDRLGRLLETDVPLSTVFDSPTPELLEQALTELIGGDSVSHDQSEVVGPVALSPGQRRFLERGSANPGHFNVSVVVRPNQQVDPSIVRNSIELLFVHHDALRLHFEVAANGVWSQQCDSAQWDDRIFTHHDLSAMKVSDRADQMALIASSTQRSFDLGNGPLFKVNMFDLGDGEQRLLIVAHHLTIDRLSLLFLLDQLDLLCKASLVGEPASLPAKTSSFKAWSETLSALGDSSSFQSDRMRWSKAGWNSIRPLPLDIDADPAQNLNSSGMSLRVKIDGDAARRVLSDPDQKVDEILLVALCRSLSSWTGGSSVLVDALGHGRRILGAPIDISRTVGYFLSYSTLLVDLSDDAVIPQIEQVRDGLERGWTLDVLRDQEQFAKLPKAQVLFNFVGRPIEAQSDSLWAVDEEIDRGPETDLAGRRDHLLAVYVETDDETINIRFVYSTNFHTEKSVSTIAQDLIRHCESGR